MLINGIYSQIEHQSVNNNNNNDNNINLHNVNKWLYIFKCRTRLIYCLRKKRNVYLTTHSTHFIYGYLLSDIW